MLQAVSPNLDSSDCFRLATENVCHAMALLEKAKTSKNYTLVDAYSARSDAAENRSLLFNILGELALQREEREKGTWHPHKN